MASSEQPQWWGQFEQAERETARLSYLLIRHIARKAGHVGERDDYLSAVLDEALDTLRDKLTLFLSEAPDCTSEQLAELVDGAKLVILQALGKEEA